MKFLVDFKKSLHPTAQCLSMTASYVKQEENTKHIISIKQENLFKEPNFVIRRILIFSNNKQTLNANIGN